MGKSSIQRHKMIDIIEAGYFTSENTNDESINHLHAATVRAKQVLDGFDPKPEIWSDQFRRILDAALEWAADDLEDKGPVDTAREMYWARVVAGLESRLEAVESMVERLTTDLPRAVGLRILQSTDGTIKMRLLGNGNIIDLSTQSWGVGGEEHAVSPLKVDSIKA